MPSLSPGNIASELFAIAPDRDERGSQLCAETLLTLAMNEYEAPSTTGGLKSPKRQQFALRSLALGENFLQGRDDIAGAVYTYASYGDQLAEGRDFAGSENMELARKALEGLIDPQTRRGQEGTWLLYPFHENLLWYDARKSGSGGKLWGVRKVYMRGSGITLARLLLDPPASDRARRLGAAAVRALMTALREESQMANIASWLEAPIDLSDDGLGPQEDERKAWDAGGSEHLAVLGEAVCAHVEGVMNQSQTGSTAKLWAFRNILALDHAVHTLRTAWEMTQTPPKDRYLLLSIGGPERAENFVRQRSEISYQRARQRIQEGIIAALARGMRALGGNDPAAADWNAEFETRGGREFQDQVTELRAVTDPAQYTDIARAVFEKANYGRPVDGFRVLLEFVGMIQGTGSYRYLTASPDIMAAFVGALSAKMPMTSRDFFLELYKGWGIVLSAEAAACTNLLNQVDGSELARNARRAERLLADAGLAVSLSDSTTIVGERVRRTDTTA